MEFLVNGIPLNKMDATEPDLRDYHPIPDHIHLSNQPKARYYLTHRVSQYLVCTLGEKFSVENIEPLIRAGLSSRRRVRSVDRF